MNREGTLHFVAKGVFYAVGTYRMSQVSRRHAHDLIQLANERSAINNTCSFRETCDVIEEVGGIRIPASDRSAKNFQRPVMDVGDVTLVFASPHRDETNADKFQFFRIDRTE